LRIHTGDWDDIWTRAGAEKYAKGLTRGKKGIRWKKKEKVVEECKDLDTASQCADCHASAGAK
jgi:hypothetical protein